MKKKALMLIMCILSTTPLTSCSSDQPPSASMEISATEAATEEETTTEDPQVSAEIDQRAQNLIKSYLNAMYEDGNALVTVKYMYPKNIVNESFQKKEQVYEQIFGGEELTGGLVVENFNVEKCVPLTEEQISNAEMYYEKYAEIISGLLHADYTAHGGREITVTATLKNSDGTQDFANTYAVVDMGDEGYKIITQEQVSWLSNAE